MSICPKILILIIGNVGANVYKLGSIIDAVPYTLKGAIPEVLSWLILKATSVAVQIENRGDRFCQRNTTCFAL